VRFFLLSALGNQSGGGRCFNRAPFLVLKNRVLQSQIVRWILPISSAEFPPSARHDQSDSKEEQGIS